MRVTVNTPVPLEACQVCGQDLRKERYKLTDLCSEACGWALVYGGSVRAARADRFRR